MIPVEAMFRDGATVRDVLVTMPQRERTEQDQVWAEGLTKIAGRLAAAANRAAQTVVQYVASGQVVGLFFDPLDVAEVYLKQELARSHSREDGERRRQLWLMDLLVKVGEARAAGCGSLAEYAPAQAYASEARAV